jgi:hypothetical protein
MKHFVLYFPKEYYDRHQIQNDGKYCQHERDYEMEQQSIKNLTGMGHFENKGLKT